MKTRKKDPTQQMLHDMLSYDADTGHFTWKTRTSACRNWNQRWAGKRAGTIRKDGYVQIAINRVPYLANRLAWIYVRGDVLSQDLDVDHRNRNPRDNRITNLRPVTRVVNLHNQPARTDLPKGVRRGRWGKGFSARIKVNYREIHLGTFESVEQAANAYGQAERQYLEAP